MLVGVKKVPAMLVVADQARQAKSFAAINGNRTRMSPLALFRAALAAGEPRETKVNHIALAAGVRLLTYPLTVERMKPGDCTAPASVLKAYEDHGESSLRAAFTAILASKGDTRGLLSSVPVRALSSLFRAKPLSLETIRKAFAHIDLNECLVAARQADIDGLITDLRNEIVRRLARLAGGAK